METAPTTDIQILRAQWHDYRDTGYYMLTLVAEHRSLAPFGIIEGTSEDTAAIRLTPMGECVDATIRSIPTYHPDIELIEHTVMPDHIHVLLHVTARMEKHLGAVVGTIKNVTTQAYLHEQNMHDLSLHLVPQNRQRDKDRQHQRVCEAMAANGIKGYEHVPVPKSDYQTGLVAEVGAIIAARVSCGLATAHEVNVTFVSPLWAPGYHDRIATRRGQIARQRLYIRRNIARLWLKHHTDRALMTVFTLTYPLSIEHATIIKESAIWWDTHRGKVLSPFMQRHDGRVYARTYLELVQKFLRKPKPKDAAEQSSTQPSSRPSRADLPAYMSMRACGNIELLRSGRPLVPVRISRSVSREGLIAEMERILSLCEREGAIPVSPFISWSEKEVLKALRLNGYAHVILTADPMSLVYKPSDSTHGIVDQHVPDWYRSDPVIPSRMSDGLPTDLACTNRGTLLTLAPWPDRPRSEKSMKADCEIMNKVCEVMGKGCEL